MDKIVVNDLLRTQLSDLEPIEFCDENGKTLGHFLPENLYKDLVIGWSKSNISDEELERRRREPEGRTLAEIWKSLGQE